MYAVALFSEGLSLGVSNRWDASEPMLLDREPQNTQTVCKKNNALVFHFNNFFFLNKNLGFGDLAEVFECLGMMIGEMHR